MPVDVPPPSAPVVVLSAPVDASGKAFDLSRVGAGEEARGANGSVLPPRRPCGVPSSDGGIVVCAQNREGFRVHDLSQSPYAPRLPEGPGVRIGVVPGVDAHVYGEQRSQPAGSVPAAMASLNFKL